MDGGAQTFRSYAGLPKENRRMVLVKWILCEPSGGKPEQRIPTSALSLRKHTALRIKKSTGADVPAKKIIRSSEPSARVISRCIHMLDRAKRGDEAEELIQQFKARVGTEMEVATAWARHALRSQNKDAALELIVSPVVARLRAELGWAASSPCGKSRNGSPPRRSYSRRN